MSKGQKYTPKVFSALRNQVPQHAEKEVCSERNKGGGKLRGGESIPLKPSSKWFWTPHIWMFSPPPMCSRNVFSLGKRAQIRQIPLSEASKSGLGVGTLWYVPPTQKIARCVLPPPICDFPICCIPKVLVSKGTQGNLYTTLGVTSTVSFFVEHNVRKQRFNTPGMA